MNEIYDWNTTSFNMMEIKFSVINFRGEKVNNYFKEKYVETENNTDNKDYMIN